MASPSYNPRRVSSGRNPLFLPKSLFDSYIVKSHGGEITVDRIQTLPSAERKVKELGKKYPCVGFDILSAKHGGVIKSYKASVGRGTPKVETDNSKRYKQEAVERAKQNVKYVLYLDGKEYASYDTKKEAEQVGRKEGGKVRVKAVVENPRKSPADMSGPEINHALDRLDKADSKLTHDFIDAGRGHERPSEYLKQSDPLAMRARAQYDERMGLRREMERRYGPDAPSRLPKGFGPRRNPLTGSPSHDIPKLRKEGYPQKQATAIAVEAQRRKRSKRNPDSALDSAADIYKQFHGEESDGVTKYIEEEDVPDTFAELGDLTELIVKGTHVKSATIKAPDPDKHDLHGIVKLVVSHDGKQIFFLGGDQSLDLAALGFTSRQESRRNIMIGVLTQVTYRTRKGFDKFRPIDYFHKLGEETGDPPYLTYDSVNQKMHVIGGNYEIHPEGVVD